MGAFSNIRNAFVTIGQHVKDIRDKIGVLSSLATTDKSSLVNAINEVNGKTKYTTNSESSDRSLVVGDKNKFIKNSANIILTFQAGLSFDGGESGVFKRSSAGTFIVEVGTGVTINEESAGTQFELRDFHSQVAWICFDTDVYELSGDYVKL